MHKFCIETLKNYSKNLENTAHFQSLMRKIEDQKEEIEQYTQVVFRLENQKDSLKKDIITLNQKLKTQNHRAIIDSLTQQLAQQAKKVSRREKELRKINMDNNFS